MGGSEFQSEILNRFVVWDLAVFPETDELLNLLFVFSFSTVCECKQQGLDILSFGHVPSITYKIIISLYHLRAKFFFFWKF